MYRSVSANRSRNDRFIPRRLDVALNLGENENGRISADPDDNNDSDFVNYGKKRYYQENYRNALRNILCPLDRKVLNFFPPKNLPRISGGQVSEEWPVKPRKKPVINSPDVILDMPDFDCCICHHVADWSGKNCLATIFENEVHMWHQDSKHLTYVTNTGKMVRNCVRWNSDGVNLALGLFPNIVGIWNSTTQKLVSMASCCNLLCEVFCLEWVEDNHLITGCSNGALKKYDSEVRTCFVIVARAHKCAIVSLACSCNKKMVASSGLDKIVNVWKTVNLEHCFRIKFDGVVRCLAWHPWKSLLLAVGCGSYLYLYNIVTQKMIASQSVTPPTLEITCLTFNPISAEIVISYFDPGQINVSRSRGIIAVLTNLNTIVEEVRMHSGTIAYLLWGHGGKLLASASDDERLCIVKFFGTPTKEFKIRKKCDNFGKFRTSIR